MSPSSGKRLLVGVTGGVCSGKSFVAGVFREEGFEVIDVDEIARSLLQKGREGYRRVVKAFGSGILRSDGEVDRKKLGKIVFDDPEARASLEGLLHPLIEEEMERQLAAAEAEVVIDSPLLVEKGRREKVDVLVVVYATEHLQLERMLQRDGLREQEALKRIKAQMPIKEKIAVADYLVDNTKTMEYTREQTLRVVADIRRKSSHAREEGSWRSSTSRS